MRKNKKNEIVTNGAPNGPTGRQRHIRPPIATAAGVTEGALYRHFKGKDDLCQQAYFTIVTDMASTKEMIALSTASVVEKVREWVRVSYGLLRPISRCLLLRVLRRTRLSAKLAGNHHPAKPHLYPNNSTDAAHRLRIVPQPFFRGTAQRASIAQRRLAAAPCSMPMRSRGRSAASSTW